MKHLIVILLLASVALAQEGRYDFGVTTTATIGGVPLIVKVVPNAAIRVCTYSLNPGTPCAPLTTTFTDATGTTSCLVTSQVVLAGTNTCTSTADGNGNFGFWAPAGIYVCQITASGIVTTNLPCSPNSGGVFSAISVKSLNNILFADQFPGSDPCAQILAAYNALPATGGIVDARGFQGTLTACAGGLTIGGSPKVVDLYLGNATFTVNNTFNLACSGGNCHVYGINGATVISQGGSFPASTPVVQIGATGETNMTMSGIQVKCGGAANSIGVKVLAQDMSGPRQMIAQQCTKYGFWFESALANNSTCYDCWALGSGATTNGFYIHTVNRWSGKNITSVANAGAGDPTASQIVIDGSTAYLDTFHVEDATNGLDVGPVASSIVEAHTGTGHSSITSVVRVENISGNRLSAYNVILNGATNTVLDSLNTVTRTDSLLPMYMTQGPNGQQVDIFDGSTGKLILIGGEAQFRDTAAGVDGRMGGGSFAAGQLGIGTANSNPTALYANSIQALKLETDGGNTLPKYSRYTETTAPGASAGFDTCYGDSTAHAIKCNFNAAGFFQNAQVIPATSAAFATATTAGMCVQSTTAVTGATTSMTVLVSPVSTPGVGAVWSAFVSSAGNITINECAVATSAGGTIAFNIRVIP